MQNVIGAMIPLASVVLGLGIALLSIYLAYRKRELIHKERLAAIEKGVELPPLPEGFLDKRGVKTARSYLIRGLVWLAVGIGVIAFFLGLTFSLPVGDGPPAGVAALGAIPALIGVAYLIFYAVEGKKMKEEESEKAAKENEAV